MLPEIGLLSLVIALCSSFLQVASLAYNTAAIVRLGLVQICCVFLSYSILTIAFLTDDFSVQYVAHTSNSSLPLYYKFTAVWGAHEGSLLLWITILNVWYLTLYIAQRRQHWLKEFTNRVFAIFGLINGGLMLLLIRSSNPFARYILQMPLDGADLNPMLQDLAMIIHPPVLYIGYVGTAAAFALTMARLWMNKVDISWAILVRPWVQTSWIFLTLGITLGSWWAYYELGWGGWWFWDPVENASFMPWLTATALLHSLAIASREGKFLRLTVFLVIITFGLSIFGTFLVRSGSVSSVHAFANDPERGMFILQFLGLILGGALLMYVLRWSSISASNNLALNRRDLAIFSNNILLMVATASILLGTMYPLLYEAVTNKPISVGFPFFNAVFLPIMLLMFFIMVPSFLRLERALVVFVSGMLLTAMLLYWHFGRVDFYALIGVAVAVSIIVSTLSSKKIGMTVAHVGLAITIIGISISTNYELARDLEVSVGEEFQFAQQNIIFQDMQIVDGPNYIGYRANILLDNKQLLLPEKRMYLAQELVISETGILPGIIRDIYIALGQQLPNAAWGLRIYYKPFVRFIWLGAIVMSLGALIGTFSIFARKVKRA